MNNLDFKLYCKNKNCDECKKEFLNNVDCYDDNGFRVCDLNEISFIIYDFFNCHDNYSKDFLLEWLYEMYPNEYDIILKINYDDKNNSLWLE